MNAKQVMELMKLPRTDAGNAERLRRMFGRTWKYLPQYRSWVHWDGHRWDGRRTGDLSWAAKAAFEKLAMEIFRLPVDPEDEAEQSYRIKIIAWLIKSQIDYHIRMAVRKFKEMLGEEETDEKERE